MRAVIDLPVGLVQIHHVAHDSKTAIPEEIELVGQARGGDRLAFGQLYKRYAPMVHGILLGRVPHQEAEDLVQDVFLLALRKLHALRDDAAFPGWLAAIARNRAHDHHRRAPSASPYTSG